MSIFNLFGRPGHGAAKVIDGQHLHDAPEQSETPRPDVLPLSDPNSKHCPRNILVALTGTDLDREIVSLACSAAKMKKSGIFAVFGIEVPRALPIDADMPKETEQASLALERAASVAEQLQVRIEPEILQSRSFGQSLVDEATAHSCALMVVGVPYHIGLGGRFDLGDAAEYALKNAPCRVWIVRGQPPTERRSEPADRQPRAEATGVR